MVVCKLYFLHLERERQIINPPLYLNVQLNRQSSGSPTASSLKTHLGSIWSSQQGSLKYRLTKPPSSPKEVPPLSPVSSAVWIMNHSRSTPGRMNHPSVMPVCGRLGVRFGFHQCLTLSPRWMMWNRVLLLKCMNHKLPVCCFKLLQLIQKYEVWGVFLIQSPGLVWIQVYCQSKKAVQLQ